MPDIAITYHTDPDDLQGDADITALINAPRAIAPFDRLAWWRGLADECGLPPWFAVARQGRAVAIMPLMHHNHRIEALANWYSFRWRPLVSDGADPMALFTALARDLARRTGRITLAPVPDETQDATWLARSFRQAGWLVECRLCDVNHMLDVKGRNYAAWLAARPGRLRTTLARKAHRAAITLYHHFDPAAWAAYEAIYARSWKPAEGSPAFLRHFAEAEGAAGRLRLGLAHHAGMAIAAQLWTVESGTAFIHKLAHDQAAQSLSPGTLLTAALLQHAIDHDHVCHIDFGTGDEKYKRDWMETIRPRYRLDMFRPEQPRNWPHITRAAFRQLADRVSHV